MPIYKIKDLEVGPIDVGPIIDDQPINVNVGDAKTAALALIAKETGAVIRGDDVVESVEPIHEKYNFIHEINCKVKLVRVHP